MKSFNMLYCDFDKTQIYILTNRIDECQDVLVQIFTGNSNKNIIGEIIQQIKSLLPQAHIIGATTAGEILNCEITAQSIVISFSTFEKTTIKAAIVKEAEDDFQLGRNLAQELITDNTKVMIIFGNALQLNGSDMLEGVASISNDFIVAGGYAGNNGYFTQTFVLLNNEISYTGLVGISLNSDVLQVWNEYSLCWRGIGKVMTVTRSEKNRVYTLDGVRTKDIYQKYLGTEVSDFLPSSATEFPLLVLEREISIVRCPMAIHTDGSVEFLGNIEEGSKVLFSYGNLKMLIEESNRIFEAWKSKPLQSIFVYSCAARYASIQDEIKKELFPLKNVPVAGFFAYGEFYQSKYKKNVVMNITTTLLGLSEAEKTDIQLKSTKAEITTLLSKENFTDDKKVTVINILNNLINAVVEDLEQTNHNLATKNKELELYAMAIKENQEVMIEREKAVSLGHLMAGIAHNLKTPLITISGGVSLIRKLSTKLESESITANSIIIKKIKKWITEIDDTLQYIGEIISTVNGYVATPEVVDAEFSISLLVRKMNILMVHELKASKCKLVIKINIKNAGHIKIKGNINDLVQVLNVLISNSIDSYEGNGGIVNIEIEQIDYWLKIAVIDYGKGIKPEIGTKLFKEMVTTKGKNGTGLGLYTAYMIIRGRFSGEMTFQSLGDKGTSFQILLLIKK